MLKRALLLVLIASMVFCNKANPVTGPTVVDNRVLSASIAGPGTVAPGASSQLTLSVVRVGIPAPTDVTSQATWVSSDASVVQVTAGRVDGMVDGEATVSATFSGYVTRKTIDVMEAGTFIVSGSVSDGSGGINGARVEVAAGTGAGRFATTTQYGGFRLFGLAGIVELRASATGYVTRSQTTTVASNMNVSFGLTPSDPPVDVSGAWQLTIDASASCSTLPDAARHRTYAAAIAQNITGLTIELAGATFASHHSYSGAENTLWGRIIQSAVTLNLWSDDYYGTVEYGVAEVLPDGAGTYTPVGTAGGTVDGRTISARLNGTISVINPSGPASACTATDHLLTLVRASTPTSRRR